MKKNSNIMLFIKGFIIGLGIIFPVSASVLAISMGIYKDILDYLNDFWHSLKTNFRFILWLGLGVVASCIVSCLLLDYTLNKFPLATLLFFIGLIVGGIPVIVKKTEKKYSLINILFSLVGIGIIVAISFLSSSQNAIISTNGLDLLKLFGVGVIGAGSMIVPGVSGSVMLIILGYYEPILSVISSLLGLNNIFNNVIIIAVFAIGMIVGVVIMSKIMATLLQKFEIKTYFAIIGFVLASVINVIISLFSYKFNIIEFIIGIVLLALGFLLSFKYLKED